MKSAVIYYSYSGNTKKVAEALAEFLMAKGQADLIALTALDESDNFFVQCRRAFNSAKAKLEPTNFDLSGYDLVCFGTPVWAFGPAPAMNTYMDRCSGLKDKPVVLFTTYGRGTGNRNCLNYMQRVLAAKAADNFTRFSIQQSKVNDKEFILSNIKEALKWMQKGMFL